MLSKYRKIKNLSLELCLGKARLLEGLRNKETQEAISSTSSRHDKNGPNLKIY